jgi:hypothetical protein
MQVIGHRHRNQMAALRPLALACKRGALFTLPEENWKDCNRSGSQ